MSRSDTQPIAEEQNGNPGYPRRKVSQNVRDARLSQLKKFLESYTRDSKPLPSYKHGKVAIAPIFRAAGIKAKRWPIHPELLDEIQKYVDKFGLCHLQDFHPPQPQISVQGQAIVRPMVYQELLKLPLVVADRSIAQYKSALIRFAAVQGKALTDEIGAELGSAFNDALSRFVNIQYGGNSDSARSALSCIRKWREKYLASQYNHNLPPTLQERVQFLLEKDGRSAQKISKTIGQYQGFVHSLASGNQKAASISALALLEKAFDVPGNTLISLCTPYNPRQDRKFCPIDRFPPELQGSEQSIGRQRREIKRQLPDDFPIRMRDEQDRLLQAAVESVLTGQHLSEYGRRQSENTRLPYRLRLPLPEQLQAECDSLIEMKRTRGAINKSNRAQRWSDGSHGRWEQMIRSFLGYCSLPTTATDERISGAGLPLEALTLGLIVSPTLVDGYLEFRRIRTDGVDSNNSRDALTFMLSMLRADSGWVAGHPELLERLPAPIRQEVGQAGDWKTLCAQQHEYLAGLHRNMEYQVSRDPFEPIMPMIATGRPLDLLQQALHNQRKELDAISHLTDVMPSEKAEMWRDHLLISLLSWLPLRGKHWPAMRYAESHQSLYGIRNGSQLRYIDGKHWGIYLEAKSFKNVRNKVIFGPKRDRDVKFLLQKMHGLKTVEPLLDMYMRVHRPFLCPGDGPVFPDESGLPLTYFRFYKIVKKWTTKYLSEYGDPTYGLRIKGVAPFGPHAFRHLMASHVVINTGSFEYAAHMLLDSPETVQKHYGIFLPEHQLEITMRQLDVWTHEEC